MNVWPWVQSLLAAFISGGANSVSAMMIAPETFNIHDLKRLGTLFIASGIIGAVMFLKKSPLPGKDGTNFMVSFLMIALVLSTTTQVGCNSSQFQTLVKSARAISIGLKAAPKSLSALHAQGFITDEDYVVDLKGLKSIVQLQDQFIDLLSTSSQIDDTNKTQYLNLVAQLAVSLQVLTANQALHIKNPDAQVAFAAIFAGIETGALTIKAFLDQVQGTVKVPANVIKSIKAA